jgi:hypothetical protein
MTKKTDKSKSTELTKKKEFKPTPAMKVWLDTAVELASDSPTEIAEKSKLTKQAWYKWLKEVDGFEDWYYKEYQNKRRRWIPTLDKIGMKQAKRGEYQFWKDMNKKAGEDLDAKQESQTNVQVNLVNSIQSDKDKYSD